MISLKKSLDQIEHYERLFQVSLQCYLDALASLERHTFAAQEAEDRAYRQRLSALRRRLAAEPTPENLQTGPQVLEGELRAYKERLEAAFSSQRREVQEILAALAEAAAALDRQNTSYAGNLRGFTRQLEAVSRLEDLSEIRRRLTLQVAQMKSSLERISREHEESLKQLRRELETFQSRLEHAEQLAATDSLTGLANRRKVEQKLAEFIRSGQEFCIMLLDLDQFKHVNDRYGHHVGDQVLTFFAQRLREQFRRSDVVGRWGGDEFIAILGCPLDAAMQKAKEVGERVSGWYTVNAGGQSLRVLIRSSAGVAEFRPGETLEQLYARADELLYANKALRVAT